MFPARKRLSRSGSNLIKRRVALILSGLFVVGCSVIILALAMGKQDLDVANKLGLGGFLLSGFGLTTWISLFRSWSIEIRQKEGTERIAILRSMAATTKLSPTEFEEEVKIIFEYLTKFHAEPVGTKGETGFDLRLIDKDTNAFVGIVQFKHYDPQAVLSPSIIRELQGEKLNSRVNYAYLVTTGRFSPEAQQAAKDLGIYLMDGEVFEKRRDEVVRRLANWKPLLVIQVPQAPAPMTLATSFDSSTGVFSIPESHRAQTRPITPTSGPTPSNTKVLPPSKRIAVNRPFPIPNPPVSPASAIDTSMPRPTDPTEGQFALRDEISELHKQIKARQERITEINQQITKAPKTPNGQVTRP